MKTPAVSMPCDLPEIQAAIPPKTVGSCSYIQNIQIIAAWSQAAWAKDAFLGTGLNPDE